MAKAPPVKRGIALIPTLLTLGNGFCGFVAISKLANAAGATGGGFDDKVIQAAWLIFLAMIFDALDGRVARLTNQASEFGVQLDSLTDVVSFAVAPALLAKVVYDHALAQAAVPHSVKLPLLLTSLYVLCAVLRLARFSLETATDDDSHKVFSGLPSPAAAGVLAAAVFFLFEGAGPIGFDANQILALKRVMIFIPPLLGLLMISKVRYVHVVNRYVRGRRTFNYLAQGILCLFLVAFCHEWAVFLFFCGYALSGPAVLLWEAARAAGQRRPLFGAKARKNVRPPE